MELNAKTTFGAASFGYLLLLLALACVGNMIAFPLLFGVDVIFGSVFVFLVLRLYGPSWGLLASAAAGFVTLLLWDHPYAMAVFLLETAFVALLDRRRTRNLVVLTAAFWLVAGMPLIGLFYRYALGMGETAVIVVMLKDTANGIFNALAASLLLAVLPARKSAGGEVRRRQISLYDILFNAFSAVVMIPLLVVLILIGREEFRHIDKAAREMAERQSQLVHADIVEWEQTHMNAVLQLARDAQESRMSDPSKLQGLATHLRKAFPDFQTLYIADGTGTTIAYDPIRNPRGLPTIGLNFADRDYFQAMKRDGKPHVTGVFVARGGVTNPVVLVGAPIMIDGRFAGVATGALDLRYLQERLAIFARNPHTHITVVDHGDRVIASTRSTLQAMQRFDWRQGGDVRAVESGLHYWQPSDVKNPMKRWGASCYINVSAVEGSGWTIVVETLVAPYRDALYAFYIKILSILLLSGVFAIAASVLFSRFVIRPITRLAVATTDLPNKMLGKDFIRWPQSPMSEITALIVNFQMMAERLRGMFREIQTLAYYDGLTGLPNRNLFTQKLETLLRRPFGFERAVSVLFIDLDRFKIVNDTIGHANGDLLLAQAAERIRSVLDPEDILSRMGGDEFTAALPDASRERTECVLNAILEAFAKPISISGHDIFITPSIGVSMYPADGADLGTLLKRADQAMYAAKDKGKNQYRFYDAGMEEAAARLMTLGTMLHKALECGEFSLHYQPRVHAETGELTAMEALIRWRHPERGWIPPSEFIPIAEETGLIKPIGEWVLRAACAQIRAWRDAGYATVPVSVNVSVNQLEERHLLRLVPEALREFDLQSGDLELEVTENVSLHSLEHMIGMLDELKQLGVQLSMDDFGTGYSSLSYLKKFPIDRLKIDRSFIRDIEERREECAIVKAIVEMAHSLGLSVTAEGVETEGQLALLRGMACDEIQGYLTGRPQPPEEILRVLAKRVQAS